VAVPQWFDRLELARAFKCSPSMIDKMRRQGMPCFRIGESPRFEMDQCLEWIRANETKDTDT
jgi:phage terminase Nu1 subunit (DNA packaging protein)